MVDINAIERALLLNVVKEQKWDVLVLHNITKDYFTVANKPMYTYIREYVETGEYPDIQLLCFNFQITDDEVASYLSIQDIQGLCEVLRNEFLKEELKYEVSQLNTKSQEMNTDPAGYVDAIGSAYDKLKLLSYTNKTVGLFDDIESILQLDPNDVISTGFEELDEKLVGWRRGEELAIFFARTGQR